MGIGPLELSGGISRTQDFANMRMQEDMKAALSQSNITQNVAKKAEQQSSTVKRADDVNNELKKFDAREKGSNEYHGDGGKGKKKENDELSVKDGNVIPKGQTMTFDIRI